MWFCSSTSAIKPRLSICNAVVVVSSMVCMATGNAVNAVHRNLQAINFRYEMLTHINEVRKSNDLDKLCINNMLMTSAQNQANDMAELEFVTTQGSDNSTPKSRAAAEGFKAEIVTEVVGAGYKDAKSIVAAWAKASSAKSTLLSNYTVMGPGYAFIISSKHINYWVADFSHGSCGNGGATVSDNDLRADTKDTDKQTAADTAETNDDSATPAPPAPPETNDDSATPAPTETKEDPATPAPTETKEDPATPAPTDTKNGSATPAPTDTKNGSATPAPTETKDDSATPAPPETKDDSAAPKAENPSAS